jgi:hypothetical protein
MSVGAYKQPSSLPPQRMDLTQPQYQNASQHVDPMVYLYNLEREIEISECRTASVMNDLAQRLDNMEAKVTHVSGRFDTVNRQLEKAVVALAHRVNQMENPASR